MLLRSGSPRRVPRCQHRSATIPGHEPPAFISPQVCSGLDADAGQVADPYRWLEDPDGADTVKWVEAQNKITDAYLSTLDTRDFLKEKLTAKVS